MTSPKHSPKSSSSEKPLDNLVELLQELGILETPRPQPPDGSQTASTPDFSETVEVTFEEVSELREAITQLGTTQETDSPAIADDQDGEEEAPLSQGSDPAVVWEHESCDDAEEHLQVPSLAQNLEQRTTNTETLILENKVAPPTPLDRQHDSNVNSSLLNILTNVPKSDPDNLEAKISPGSQQLSEDLPIGGESLAEETAENPPKAPREFNSSRTRKEGTLNYETLDNEQVSQLLLPLIIEMFQVNESRWQDSLFEALVPMIDQVIQQRSRQNRQAMSVALAELIPEAISQEIRNNPRQVARAIAPEIALAIQEQISLDRDAIANALASEMGRAIKAQIELERDAMVDALYPVIGSTISKYMAEFVQSINEKLERNLTPEAIQRKFRAKIQGVSEEELIFRESLPVTVQAVFLIHKASGLVMADVQPTEENRLEADMLAGMLTAIRSFVNDCIARNGDVLELSEIESGDSKIIIEAAGYCYIAVVVKGEPSQGFMRTIRDTFANIVQKHNRILENYEGDPAVIPEVVLSSLEAIRTYPQQKAEKQGSKFPGFILVVLLILLGLITLPLGFLVYRSWRSNALEEKVAIALDQSPELSVYRLTPNYQRGTMTLTGKVPNLYLKSQAEQLAQATLPEQEIVNEVIAIEIPTDPLTTQTQLERIETILNQDPAINFNTRYAEGQVFVEGSVWQPQQIQKVTNALAEIPGVSSVVSSLKIEPPQLDTRLYFNTGSTEVNENDLSTKIAAIVRYLNLYPDVHLRIIGYTDNVGLAESNRQLALQRANAVKQVLQARGISLNRLQIAGTTDLPPGVNPDQPQWLRRSVHFDPYIPDLN